MMVLLMGLLDSNAGVLRSAYMLFLTGALTTIVAMRSGEQAEEFTKHLSGFDQQLVEQHEVAAERLAYMNYAAGLLAGIALIVGLKRPKALRYTAYAILLVACMGMYFSWQVGHSGGQIRHPEIMDLPNKAQQYEVED